MVQGIDQITLLDRAFGNQHPAQRLPLLRGISGGGEVEAEGAQNFDPNVLPLVDHGACLVNTLLIIS